MGEGWQPIATAPRNVDVIVFAPDAAEPKVFTAHLLEFEGDPDPPEWYPANADAASPLDVTPTHWHPLPEPPA